jgi:hypothetical protein
MHLFSAQGCPQNPWQLRRVTIPTSRHGQIEFIFISIDLYQFISCGR